MKKGRAVATVLSLLAGGMVLLICAGLCGFSGLVWQISSATEAERVNIRAELDRARGAGDVDAERSALLRLRDTGPATRRQATIELAELELRRGDKRSAATHVSDLVKSEPHLAPPDGMIELLGEHGGAVRDAWFNSIIATDARATRLPFLETQGAWAVAVQLSDASELGEGLSRAAGSRPVWVLAIRKHPGVTSQGDQLQWADTWIVTEGEARSARLPLDDPHQQLIDALGADPAAWYFYAARQGDSVATQRLIEWIDTAEPSAMSATLQLLGVVRTMHDNGDDTKVFVPERVAHLPDPAVTAFATRFKTKTWSSALLQGDVAREAKAGFIDVLKSRGLPH
ncbi:MAG: hypothetical protein ACI9MC_003018 [Kiritimatiellia bacterium]|jgi:hypothetical protein